MARSIAGLFPDRSSAERAIEDLKDAGFDPGRIGVVLKDKGETKEVTAEHGTRSGEGAVAGGIVGGTAGALLAATGALVIPGVGPFIAGGIVAAALGAGAGALVGGLVGLGIPEDEAKYYQEQVSQGSALVTVDAQGRDDEARAILLRDGARDLQGQGFGTAATAPVAASMATPVDQSNREFSRDGGDIRVPVREEELVVDKRPTEEGRVHLHKDVVEERQTVNVPLRQERVAVDRVPFSGDATTAADAFTERDIDVPVMGEEAVVGKRVMGVEEVVIRKDVVTEQRQVADSVRKERVTVDGVDQDGQTTAADRLRDAGR